MWQLRFTVLACLLSFSALSPTSQGGSLDDERWDALFKRYAEINIRDYHWHWTKAQAYQESKFDPAAVSPVGATGLMQIMPGTGRDLAIRTGVHGPLTSPTISVLYGTTYMRKMLGTWSTPRPAQARLELAFASYNAGAGHIIKAQKLADGALFWDDIKLKLPEVTGRHSKETITYVQRIHGWKEELDGSVQEVCH